MQELLLTNLRNGSIYVKDGLIKDICTTYVALNRYKNVKQVDLTGFTAIPGLINAHSHVAMGFFRDLGSDTSYESNTNSSMIESFMFPAEKSLDEDLVQSLSYSYLIDGLKSGVTCFADHYYFIEGVAKALKRLGLRGFVGETLADLGGAFPSINKFDEVKKTIENWPYDDTILPVLAPHAADTVSSKLLTEIALFAKHNDLSLHMHLSQTTGEHHRVISREKISPVKYADSCGALTDKSVLVHLVSANEKDFDLIEQRGSTVCICPASEILYETLPNFNWLFNKNIAVAIGTDCAASCDGSDILAEIRLTALLCRYFKTQPKYNSSTELLKLVTTNPYKAFGAENKLGSLEQGKTADIVFIKDSIERLPISYEDTNVIYSSSSRNVTHVMINGQWVLWNRELQTANENDLKNEYTAAVSEIKKRSQLQQK